MDTEGTMLSELGQIQKDKFCTISLMWNLKNKPRNKYNKMESGSQI